MEREGEVSVITDADTWDELFEQINQNVDSTNAAQELSCEQQKSETLDSVATLPYKKASCYGNCPVEDKLKLVICKDCGMVIKPVGYGHHMKLRHGFNSSSSSASDSEDEYRAFLLSPLHFLSPPSTSKEKLSCTKIQQSYYVEKFKDLKMVLTRTPKKTVTSNYDSSMHIHPSTHHYGTRSKQISVDESDSSLSGPKNQYSFRGTMTPRSLAEDDVSSQKSWEDERTKFWIKIEVIVSKPPPLRPLKEVLQKRQQKRRQNMSQNRVKNLPAKEIVTTKRKKESTEEKTSDLFVDKQKLDEDEKPRENNSDDSPEMHPIARLLKVPGLSFELRTGNGDSVAISNLADAPIQLNPPKEDLTPNSSCPFNKYVGDMELNLTPNSSKEIVKQTNPSSSQQFQYQQKIPEYNTKLTPEMLSQTHKKSVAPSIKMNINRVNPYHLANNFPASIKMKPVNMLANTVESSSDNKNGMNGVHDNIRKHAHMPNFSSNRCSDFDAIHNQTELTRKRSVPFFNTFQQTSINPQNIAYLPNKKRPTAVIPHYQRKNDSMQVLASANPFIQQRFRGQELYGSYSHNQGSSTNSLRSMGYGYQNQARFFNSESHKHLNYQQYTPYSSNHGSRIYPSNGYHGYELPSEVGEEQLIEDGVVDDNNSSIIPSISQQPPRAPRMYRRLIHQTNNRGVLLLQQPASSSSNVVILPHNAQIQPSTSTGSQFNPAHQEFCYIEDEYFDSSITTGGPMNDGQHHQSIEVESVMEDEEDALTSSFEMSSGQTGTILSPLQQQSASNVHSSFPRVFIRQAATLNYCQQSASSHSHQNATTSAPHTQY